MARKSAQLLLLIAPSMSALLTGCILPPDGKGGSQSLGPYPPQVDLAQVFPRKPKLRQTINDPDDNCFSTQLSVDEISDRDSDQLLFRWVANNNLENTVLLGEEGRLVPVEQRVARSITHREAFNELVRPPGGTGVISLFITDAPSWAEEAAEPTGESKDWSAIAEAEDASVIEVRWTFEFGEFGAGTCEE